MLLGRATVTDREREQRRIKAELLMEACAQLGVDALGIGEGELAFGVDFLREGAARHALPYVSANIVDSQRGEPLFPASRTVERGGLRFGITAVTMQMAAPDRVQVLDPTEAVRSVVTPLRDEVDMVIVLSHLGIDADRDLAVAVEGIDLIVGSHSRRYQPTPLVVGRTAIVQAGSMGKKLGQLELDLRRRGAGWSSDGARERALRRSEELQRQLDRYGRQISDAPDEDSRERLQRIRLLTRRRLDDLAIPPENDGRAHRMVAKHIPMGPSLREQEAMAALVRRQLESLGLAPVGGRPAALQQGEWVGGSQCIACHREHFAEWKKGGHATAYRTLVGERRQFDLQCWSCHVTGAGRVGGPETPQQVGYLRNVQCEACHGPGRRHLADPEGGHIVRDPGQAVCLECHTPEQTEGRFVYEEYLRQVDHRALRAE